MIGPNIICLGVIGPDENSFKLLLKGTNIPYIAVGDLSYSTSDNANKDGPRTFYAGFTLEQRFRVQCLITNILKNCLCCFCFFASTMAYHTGSTEKLRESYAR